MDATAFFDRWQEKLISRRFLAWKISTILCLFGKLESEHWAYVTMFFIGGEVLEKYKDVIMNFFKK
jgi:hypothetical protein